MKRNRLLALFTALVLVISTMLSSVSFAAENTDIAGTEFEGVVGKLSAVGVMQGYPDGTFRPDGEITRAEFAAIAVRALGLGDAATVSAGNTQFSDVPYTHWAAGYINLAVDRGIIKGYTDGTFKPEGKITNAEAITILVRLIGLGPVVDKQGTWPANYIAAANTNGILDGVNVASTVNATRGNAAKMLVNTLEAELWGPEGYNDDGSVSYGKLEDETLLSENLEITSLEGVMLYDLDDEEIELGDETYDYVGEEVEKAELFLNLVDAWVNDDDEVIYVVSTSDVVLDAIEVDLSDEEVKAVEADKDYDLNLDEDDDLDVVAYVNGEKVDVEDLDEAYDYAKLVLNDKNDVIAIDAYNWDDHIIVNEVDDYDVIGYGDEELDTEDYTIVKDGVVISVDDLEEEDILFYNDDAEFAEVYNNSVTGEIEKVYTDRIEVDDEDYEYATMQYVNEDDELVDFNEDAAEQYEDEGDAVTIFLTRAGDPIFITGNLGEEDTSTLYAYVTEDQESYSVGRNDYYNLNVVNEMEEQIDYDLDKDDVDDNFTDKTWSVGDIVAIEVDEDGDVKDVDVLGIGEGHDTLAITISDKEVDDKYVNGKRLLSSSIIFDVEDVVVSTEDEGTVDEFNYVEDTDDILVSTIGKADFTDIIDADIYVDEDDEVIVLVVRESDRDTDSTTYDAVATADAVTLSDDETWRLKLVVDGEEGKYYTKEGENVLGDIDVNEGDLLVVKINDTTGEIDEVSFADNDFDEKDRAEFDVLVSDVSASNETINDGAYILDDAVILDGTDDYEEIRVRDLEVGDKLDLLLVDEGSKYVTYAVRTELGDGEDDSTETSGSVDYVGFDDATGDAVIVIDSEIYEITSTTVLYNADGSVAAVGKSAVVEALESVDTVDEVVVEDGEVVSITLTATDDGSTDDGSTDDGSTVSSDVSVSSVEVAGVTATVDASDDTVYNVELPSGTDLSSLTYSDIVVTAADSNATVGTATSSDGGSTWEVEVTAEDGSTETYIINVTVALSSDTSVSSVEVAGVTATVDASDDTVYNVELPSGTDLSLLTYSDIVVTATDSNATVGTATTSDSGNTWEVKVTAEDGTEATYTIYVTLEP